VRRCVLPFSVLVALGLVVGAGCSAGSDPKSSPTSTSLAPEATLASNAKVTEGLKSLGLLAASASKQATSSASAAKTSADQAAEQWRAIEGRIKKNDTSAYLEFEDALSDLRVGAQDRDAAKVARGAASIAATTSAYLAKYPG
jgi:hypothetical protein